MIHTSQTRVSSTSSQAIDMLIAHWKAISSDRSSSSGQASEWQSKHSLSDGERSNTRLSVELLSVTSNTQGASLGAFLSAFLGAFLSAFLSDSFGANESDLTANDDGPSKFTIDPNEFWWWKSWSQICSLSIRSLSFLSSEYILAVPDHSWWYHQVAFNVRSQLHLVALDNSWQQTVAMGIFFTVLQANTISISQFGHLGSRQESVRPQMRPAQSLYRTQISNWKLDWN